MFTKGKISLRANFIWLAAIVLCATALFALPARSAELSAARPAVKFEAAYDDTFSYSIPVGSLASELPSAYLFYSADGSAFYFQRWFDGAPEASFVNVPANSSIMIPAPTPIIVGLRYSHVFLLMNTAGTDSVVVIPFNR